MNLSEIKKLINISGGKIILSDGDLKNSFVVMRIGDYLAECKRKNENLTDEDLLNKIDADIEELRRRKKEEEVADMIESEFVDEKSEEEFNYEKM